VLQKWLIKSIVVVGLLGVFVMTLNRFKHDAVTSEEAAEDGAAIMTRLGFQKTVEQWAGRHQAIHRGFLKWWVSPTTMGKLLLKMISTWGGDWGVPPFKETSIFTER